MVLIAGILWGVFVTHNVEQTHYFKCKYDKNESSCEIVKQLEMEKK